MTLPIKYFLKIFLLISVNIIIILLVIYKMTLDHIPMTIRNFLIIQNINLWKNPHINFTQLNKLTPSNTQFATDECSITPPITLFSRIEQSFKMRDWRVGHHGNELSPLLGDAPLPYLSITVNIITISLEYLNINQTSIQ